MDDRRPLTAGDDTAATADAFVSAGNPGTPLESQNSPVSIAPPGVTDDPPSAEGTYADASETEAVVQDECLAAGFQSRRRSTVWEWVRTHGSTALVFAIIYVVLIIVYQPHLLLAQTTTSGGCLLYTSDAADDLLCVDLRGRRIIKKKHLLVILRLLATHIILDVQHNATRR